MRTTTKILIITLSLLLGFSVIIAVLMKVNLKVIPPIQGSGIVISEERSIGDFTDLSIAGNARVILSQGDSARLTIRADDNLLDVFEITEKNGELAFYQFRRVSKGSTLELHLTFVDLNSLKVSRGGKVTSQEALNFDSFDMVVTSGADLDLTIQSTVSTVKASSGSHATISGSTLEFDVRTSSGASVDGSDLEAQNVSVKTSSGASNLIWVTNSLSVEASSGSSVTYSGNPATKVERASSGASIRSRN